MRYLAHSLALWRLLCDSDVRTGWTDVISDHAIGSCQPQRTEFRRSARNLDEYEQMTSMFVDLYPDVPLPKTAWQWVESAQYRLLRAGAIEHCPVWICSSALVRPFAGSWSCTMTTTSSQPRNTCQTSPSAGCTRSLR